MDAYVEVEMITRRSIRAVVVEAGFAGLAAARTLAKAGALVTLIDHNPDPTFQPLLYPMATAVIGMSDVPYPADVQSFYEVGAVCGCGCIREDELRPCRCLPGSRGDPASPAALACGARPGNADKPWPEAGITRPARPASRRVRDGSRKRRPALCPRPPARSRSCRRRWPAS
ncbi:hypothetical protein FR742_19860 [Nonomuraea sp. C10]|nr:hypothetical protein FR742_19860 [Nonomuraea sp. C10]